MLNYQTSTAGGRKFKPGSKKGPRLGDSASLWNFTRSPGWTKDEKDMLILLLQVYGIGNWRAIIESDMLPGKRITQMNGQTQRLVGQQSLAAISRLSVDIDRIRADNEAKTDVRRKGGLIIWTGRNPTTTMRNQWKADAKARYELPEEEQAESRRKLEELMTVKRTAEADDRRAHASVSRKTIIHLPEDMMSQEEKARTLCVLQRKVQAWLAILADSKAGDGLAYKYIQGVCCEPLFIIDEEDEEFELPAGRFEAVLADAAMKTHRHSHFAACWAHVQQHRAQQLAAAGKLQISPPEFRLAGLPRPGPAYTYSHIRISPGAKPGKADAGPSCRDMLRQADDLVRQRAQLAQRAQQQAQQRPAGSPVAADVEMVSTSAGADRSQDDEWGAEQATICPQHKEQPRQRYYRPSQWAPLSTRMADLDEREAAQKRKAGTPEEDPEDELHGLLIDSLAAAEEAGTQAEEIVYANAHIVDATAGLPDAAATAAAVQEHIAEAQRENQQALARLRPPSAGSRPAQRPSPAGSQPAGSPTPADSQPAEQSPSADSKPASSPAPAVSEAAHEPSPAVGIPGQEQPSAHSKPPHNAAPDVSVPVHEATSADSKYACGPTPADSRPAQAAAPGVSIPANQPPSADSRPAREPTPAISKPASSPALAASEPASNGTPADSKPAVPSPAPSTAQQAAPPVKEMLKAAVKKREPAPRKKAQAKAAAKPKPVSAAQQAPDPRLAQLVEMGFSKRHAADALKDSNGSISEAIEWLMRNVV